MCGIMGIVTKGDSISSREFREMSDKLFMLSQSRGKDASGFALGYKDTISVFKIAESAETILSRREYKEEIDKAMNENAKDTIMFVGHARMVTNGAMADNRNNQPVIKDGLVGVHNGIITNDRKIWKRHPHLHRKYEVDTEVFLSLLRMYLNRGFSLKGSISKTYTEIEGAASIALLFEDRNQLLLSTNTGSLYIAHWLNKELLLFSSERYFIERTIQSCAIGKKQDVIIQQVRPGTGYILDGNGYIQADKFTLRDYKHKFGKKKKKSKRLNRKINNIVPKRGCRSFALISHSPANRKKSEKLLMSTYEDARGRIDKLKRCRCCILPETMPFIQYDEKGVCNYCRIYKKTEVKGHAALQKAVAPFRRKDDRPDCIVTFSGGRDSSFGLYYIKSKLKLNPVAYSYDWGMLTDLGRRNQSRMTAALGVEHVLISADIRKKRLYIKKNVEAWLRRPDLGMVPLFMAGDKQYFYFANQLGKQMDIDLIILCENPLERTDFKSGFCGIPPNRIKNKKFYMLNFKSKLQLMFYYSKNYITNPTYLNKSIIDTAYAFISYYAIPHDYLSIYDYIKWDESRVNTTLRQYNWERADDTPTTWRIGDGTVALYNYIYYIGAGLTESDTFRSNQIREGMLTRKKALAISKEENKPRVESINWYCRTVDLNLYNTTRAIARMKRLY